MEHPRFLGRITLLFILNSVAIGYAQEIAAIRDLPFVGTSTDITPRGIGNLKIARASNGSTFVEELSPQGVPRSIRIMDIPHQRWVTLNMIHRTYTTHAIAPMDCKTVTRLEFVGLLQRVQQTDESLRNSTSDTQVRVSPLGTKEESGMMLYGARTLYEKDNQTVEIWESADLGVTYSYKTSTPQGVLSESKLGAVRYEEPDASFFEIPKGYRPEN